MFSATNALFTLHSFAEHGTTDSSSETLLDATKSPAVGRGKGSGRLASSAVTGVCFVRDAASRNDSHNAAVLNSDGDFGQKGVRDQHSISDDNSSSDSDSSDDDDDDDDDGVRCTATIIII